MRALFDVNVLISLLDAAHTQHVSAHAWLQANIGHGWASCPITQNGLVRIMSQPAYPQAISPTRAAELLRGATGTRHHAFWADDLSVLDASQVDMQRVHGPRQITDAYLLALAVQNRGRFVTFDSSIVRSAVPRARPENLVAL